MNTLDKLFYSLSSPFRLQSLSVEKILKKLGADGVVDLPPRIEGFERADFFFGLIERLREVEKVKRLEEAIYVDTTVVSGKKMPLNVDIDGITFSYRNGKIEKRMYDFPHSYYEYFSDSIATIARIKGRVVEKYEEEAEIGLISRYFGALASKLLASGEPSYLPQIPIFLPLRFCREAKNYFSTSMKKACKRDEKRKYSPGIEVPSKASRKRREIKEVPNRAVRFFPRRFVYRDPLNPNILFNLLNAYKTRIRYKIETNVDRVAFHIIGLSALPIHKRRVERAFNEVLLRLKRYPSRRYVFKLRHRPKVPKRYYHKKPVYNYLLVFELSDEEKEISIEPRGKKSLKRRSYAVVDELL